MATARDIDIVIYGATGFTGRLVAEYMAARQGHGLRWALAGRSIDRLAALRDEIGAPADLSLIEADAEDPGALRAMVRRAECICAIAGPYQLHGSGVVAACAELGTAYVDLSGEPGWMHEMISRHAPAARASGARIVHSCGFDSIPFDLGVMHLQQLAKERFGRPCRSVKARVRAMKGKFSGGTAASLNATEDAMQGNTALFEVMSDPFSLTGGFQGPEQPDDQVVQEDPDLGLWVAPFLMAVINSKNIHRSNALLGHPYGTDFQYSEMMVAGPGEEGRKAAELIAGHNPLRGERAPRPGEGPSREVREAGFFDVLFVGRAADGEELRTVVKGDMDPGYGSTSKMVAESAICLVRDSPDLPGGFYTPASSMGFPLIERLQRYAGLSFGEEN